MNPQSSPLKEVAEWVLARTCERLDVPAALLLLEERGGLQPVAQIGLADVPPSFPTPSAEEASVTIPAIWRQTLPQWLSLPLSHRGNRVGWLLLGGPEQIAEETGPDPRDDPYLEPLARLLVSHAEFSRQRKRIQVAEEYARQRALIHEISTLLNTTVDVEEILHIAVQEMARAFAVEHCSLSLYDDEKTVGQVVAEFPQEGIVGTTLPVESHPAAEYILRTGQSLAIADIPGDPRLGPTRPLVEQLGIRSALILPLKADDEILGTIELDAISSPRTFSLEEITTAQTVANQVAGAIGRARLFQAKQASEANSWRLVEQAHSLVWTLDLEGCCTYVNPVAERVTGCSAETQLGQPFDGLVVPEDLTPAAEAFRKAVAGQPQSVRVRIRDASGGIRHLLVASAPLRDGDETVGILCFGHDVTDREKFSDELVQRTGQAEKRVTLLRAVGDLSRQMLAVFDAEALVQIAADALVNDMGYEYASVLLLEEGDALVIRASEGRFGKKLVGLRVLVGTGIAGRVAATGEPLLCSDVLKDQHYHPLEEMGETRSELAAPIRGTDGIRGVLDVQSVTPNAFDEADLLALSSLADQVGVVLENARLYGSLREQMAELEHTRAQLSEAEKLSVLGELIAGAAHELNNPLLTVMGYAQLLQDMTEDPAILRDLSKIAHEAQRAARIVGDLLTFARQRKPNFQPIDVNAILQETVGLQMGELYKDRIEVDFDLAPNLPLARADHHQLEQVLLNLVRNARQAISETKDSGKLALGTTWYEDPSSPPKRWIRTEVYDDGPGIPPKALPRIFDPFFTTRPASGGTGLGLSICHGIVERHGGRIWAENLPEGGARFVIELPAWQPAEPSEETETPSASQPVAGGQRILVADGEAMVAHFLRRSLNQMGCETEVVEDGYAALERLQREHFDAVICEVRLPGLSGEVLHTRLQQTAPDLAERILFMTADTMDAKTVFFLRVTGKPYLTKPFTIEELWHALQGILRKENDDG